MAATTIDPILLRLNDLIDQSIREADRVGYFVSLYARVTSNVRRAILAGGVFEDNARMERLDVIFANRFLEAYDLFKAGQAPTQSWQVCFLVLDDAEALVLQHLFLGMNAHINLDLGIAAAEIAQDAAGLAALHADFLKINKVLSRLVDVVKAELAEVSPRIGHLERFGPEIQEKIFDFGMAAARDGAWELAERLIAAPKADWPAIIAAQDDKIANLGRALYPLRAPASYAVNWIAAVESRNVRMNIQIIAS